MSARDSPGGLFLLSERRYLDYEMLHIEDRMDLD
jgi:hypothetical protein